jgi:hypothetical protein
MMPAAPARLAIEHATQSMTASARTVTLLRHLRPDPQEHVAARPQTRSAGKIFRNGIWALALAQRRSAQLRHFLDHVDRCLPSGWRTDLRWPRRLPAPLAIAARLLATALLAWHTGSVRSAAPPATPTPGLAPARLTAIACLRTAGAKRLFTPLEQTAPLSKVGSRFLCLIRLGPILRWAHGSRQLPGSSLGGELPLDSETLLLVVQMGFRITTGPELRQPDQPSVKAATPPLRRRHLMAARATSRRQSAPLPHRC